MKRDLKKELPPLGSRRELIRLIGATAAASPEGGAGEQFASSEQRSAPMQKTRSTITRIDAKPEPIAIDTAETAVIVVDMQNDFGSKGGMFDRAGIDISMIQRAVAPTARVLAAARKAEALRPQKPKTLRRRLELCAKAIFSRRSPPL
jgi:hypothetical protein